MTDMNIQKYFDYCITNNILNNTHADAILQMYNSLPIYQFDDVFNNTTLTIYKRHSKTMKDNKFITDVLEAIQVYSCYDNNKHYKIMQFDDNDYQYIHILNMLKEVYFQNSFHKYITDNNIEHTIVPEILRYGIIQISHTNKIISFLETTDYIDNTNMFNEPNYITQIRNIEDMLTRYSQTLLLIKQIQTDLDVTYNPIKGLCEANCYNPTIEDNLHEYTITQLTHYTEDVPSVELYESSYQTWKNSIELLISHITSGPGDSNRASDGYCRGITKYNDKFVICDFSYVGYTSQITNPRDIFDAIISSSV